MVPKERMNPGQAHHAGIPVIAGVVHGLIEIEVDLPIARSGPEQGDEDDEKGEDVRHWGRFYPKTAGPGGIRLPGY